MAKYEAALKMLRAKNKATRAKRRAKMSKKKLSIEVEGQTSVGHKLQGQGIGLHRNVSALQTGRGTRRLPVASERQVQPAMAHESAPIQGNQRSLRVSRSAGPSYKLKVTRK